MKFYRSQFGFTLVEVVVIIAVIGILASLVIANYGNITRSARNTKTTTAVSQYRDALKLFVRERGDYPTTPYTACLGTGYKDTNNNGTGDCWHLAWPVEVDPTFNEELQQYMGGTLPEANTHIVQAPDYDQVGAAYFKEDYLRLDGERHDWMIAYTMEGNEEKCPVGPVLSMPEWPQFSSEPPASGYTEKFGDVAVGCWIALPPPDEVNS